MTNEIKNDRHQKRKNLEFLNMANECGHTTPAATPEPMPNAGLDYVLPSVIKDINARDAVGRKKYGTSLQTNNGRDALNDAYQEALDLSMYLKQAIIERDYNMYKEREVYWLDFTEYQEKAYSTCTTKCYTDEYLDLGYLSEVGELAGKFAKRIRGDRVPDDDIKHEIGDIAYMIAVKARLHGESIVLDSDAKWDMHGIKEAMQDLSRDSLEDMDFISAFQYLKDFCEYLGFDFNECLKMNNEKLRSRQNRGKIKGNGDHR